MSQDLRKPDLSQGADDELIVPVDFTPADARRKGVNISLRPATVALGGALLTFAGAAWFVLTAKSIYFDVDPIGSDVNVRGPMAIKVGPRYLIRQGEVDISVSAEGYYDLDTTISISPEQAQTFAIDLVRLPGFLNLETGGISGASVYINGEQVGVTPLTRLELPAGEHSLRLEMDRYEPVDTVIEIEGRHTEQDLDLALLPAWANISFSTNPPGATVTVDGEDIGVTPLNAELLQGEREVVIKLPAHKAWTDDLKVVARQDQNLPTIQLESADGLVMLRSNPSNASVMLNGTYQGRTPLEITVPPERQHQLSFILNGYQEHRRNLRIQPGQEASVNVELDPILSSVEIRVQPEDAELYINGQRIGNANRTVELLAASQTIEVRRDGYVSYETEFISRPGLEQKLDIRLKSLEQQRLESIRPEITTVAGQTLKLLYPGAFTMGASRREQGRQANEVQRNINLTRPFYLSVTEVTNAQYKRFNSDHSSGVLQGRTLDNPSQPVVRVSWEDAALYCNWLSEQESLPPFYKVENGKVTGFNPDSTGYRLPTEAEWEWAARTTGPGSRELLRFPWGDNMPPPENFGNFADLSAANFLGRVINNYDDGYMGSAPVASFAPNANGFYDMGGNVAEWVNDYYGAGATLGNTVEENPLGPSTGTYNVIKGSSWAHGTITELRLSFRDYGDEPRDDVGFRIARYLD